MKIADVQFTAPGVFDYRRACLLNFIVEGPAYKKKIRGMIARAKDMEELIDLILGDQELDSTLAYAAISKEAAFHKERIRNMLCDRLFTTVSDAGGVKVGSGSCATIIPNGYGDGTTNVAVVDKDSFNIGMLNFFTMIQGSEINIYAYDCGEVIERTIAGRYGVFSGYGFVVFVKWD